MSPHGKYRLLEMIPGGLTWLTFALAIVLSFFKPIWVIYFIIVFCFLWLLRVLYFVFYLVISWRRYRHDVQVDWFQKLQDIPGRDKIFHIIFLPAYKESLDVIRPTFQNLINSIYPKDKFIVVLAGEERAGEHFLRNAEAIKKEFGEQFFKLFITIHPANLPDEIPGKGSNNHWAARQVKQWIDQENIPYDNIIVSSFDVDTCVHPQYFSCLTYKYLTNLKPTRSSYQPVALFNNNIWTSTFLMRVAAFSTTFWLLTELARPERLFTFSSHSMSWRALVDVGFWEKDIVTEDSRIFLQGFLRYNGDYNVVPLYVPVSMDTVMAETWRKSLVNLYKQQRRWGWGVEHFPYMLWHFGKNKLIPWQKKFYYLLNLGEGMYSWATAPILIFVLGRLPLWFVGSEAEQTVLIQNTPYILEILLQVAMAGILFSAILSLFLLPPRPTAVSKYKYLIMLFQWICLPFTLIVFGSIPAAEAQTRLMIGKYLGFWSTDKVRT